MIKFVQELRTLAEKVVQLAARCEVDLALLERRIAELEAKRPGRPPKDG